MLFFSPRHPNPRLGEGQLPGRTTEVSDPIELALAEIGRLEIDMLVDAMKTGLTHLREPAGRAGLSAFKPAARIGSPRRIAACE